VDRGAYNESQLLSDTRWGRVIPAMTTSSGNGEALRTQIEGTLPTLGLTSERLLVHCDSLSATSCSQKSEVGDMKLLRTVTVIAGGMMIVVALSVFSEARASGAGKTAPIARSATAQSGSVSCLVNGEVTFSPGVVASPSAPTEDTLAFALTTGGGDQCGGSGYGSLSAMLKSSAQSCDSGGVATGTGTIAWSNGDSSTARIHFRLKPATEGGDDIQLHISGKITAGLYTGDNVGVGNNGLHLQTSTGQACVSLEPVVAGTVSGTMTF
jgi:hypothetical protein